MQEVIAQRQLDVDDDANIADLVAAYFRNQLKREGQHPETCNVFVPTTTVAEWLVAATGAKIRINRATPYLKMLSIPELRYTKQNGTPGWVWRGPQAAKTQQLVFLGAHRVSPLY
jgi:hypothetical protein